MKLRTLLTAGVTVMAISAFGGPDSFVGKKVLFSMTTFAGKKVNSKSLAGKVVILDFWASWCGPCKAASPTMDALQKQYAGKLAVIGADVLETNPKAAAAYTREHHYTFTQNNNTLGKTLGINTIPVIMVLDKKGVVTKVFTYFNKQVPPALEAEIKRLAAH